MLKAELELLSGTQSKERIEIINELVMGRGSDCGLIIQDDPKISRKHLRVFLENGDFVACDTGSRNGTLVNGEYINSVKLHDGDLIELGHQRYRFIINEESGEEMSEAVTSQVEVEEKKVEEEVKITESIERDTEELYNEGLPLSGRCVHDLVNKIVCYEKEITLKILTQMSLDVFWDNVPNIRWGGVFIGESRDKFDIINMRFSDANTEKEVKIEKDLVFNMLDKKVGILVRGKNNSCIIGTPVFAGENVKGFFCFKSEHGRGDDFSDGTLKALIYLAKLSELFLSRFHIKSLKSEDDLKKHLDIPLIRRIKDRDVPLTIVSNKQKGFFLRVHILNIAEFKETLNIDKFSELLTLIHSRLNDITNSLNGAILNSGIQTFSVFWERKGNVQYLYHGMLCALKIMQAFFVISKEIEEDYNARISIALETAEDSFIVSTFNDRGYDILFDDSLPLAYMRENPFAVYTNKKVNDLMKDSIVSYPLKQEKTGSDNKRITYCLKNTDSNKSEILYYVAVPCMIDTYQGLVSIILKKDDSSEDCVIGAVLKGDLEKEKLKRCVTFIKGKEYPFTLITHEKMRRGVYRIICKLPGATVSDFVTGLKERD